MFLRGAEQIYRPLSSVQECALSLGLVLARKSLLFWANSRRWRFLDISTRYSVSVGVLIFATPVRRIARLIRPFARIFNHNPYSRADNKSPLCLVSSLFDAG
jgi:hypothetical protein